MFCLAALQTSAQKTQQKPQELNFKGLDTAFARILQTWHTAGFAVAVVKKNQIIYAQGFGYRDLTKKLPVTPNTLFAIGSCSKAFTAALIGQLEQQGKLDLDKPVNNYLPSLRFYNDNMTNTITLRDMMSHRTGLPRHDLSWYLFTTNSRDSLMQRVQYQEPTAGIRQRWQYNNFMFAGLAAVAEKMTGKSWEDNIREQFFVPLGMDRSCLSIPELEKADDASYGYDVKHDSLIHKMDYYHINAMAPAGAINSSVNDMAKWVITWINNGKYNDKEIIPAGYRDQAISPQSIVGGGLPGKELPDVYFADYGFGWFLSSYKGYYRVEHGGNIDGFSANTSFFPSDSIGIIVLTNQNSSPVPSIVRNLLADRILHLEYADWSGTFKKEADKNKTEAEKLKKEKITDSTFHPATHPYTDFQGVYSNAGYGSIHVFAQKDSLFAKVGDRLLWLKHSRYDFFDIYEKDPHDGIDTSETSPLSVGFNMNPTGEIESLSSKMEADLPSIVFTKGVDAKVVSAAELQKYAGDYVLAGITAKVSVRNSTLYILVPGQPEYELTPLGNDKFALKVLSGYYAQFGPAGSEKITECTFIQPNGSFKAVKK